MPYILDRLLRTTSTVIHEEVRLHVVNVVFIYNPYGETYMKLWKVNFMYHNAPGIGMLCKNMATYCTALLSLFMFRV